MGSKSFDLNIEKILENWEVRHAVREVIANALDEQLLTGTNPVEIKKCGDTWFIRDYGRGIRHTHLTQNENQEKLESPSVIGRFGIGLKDALATFERHHVIVKIRSKFGTIRTTKTLKHGFGDIVTLHAIIEESNNSEFVGTEFEMQGVDDLEMEAAKALFLTFSDKKVLDTTRFGQVISPGIGPGAIYISGVKVAEEANFLFSYNITLLNAAIKKAINRERSHVGRTAYTDSVKKILLASNSQDVAFKLSADIAHFQVGTMHDELGWLDVQEHAVRILNAQGNVMLVTASEAMNYPDLIHQARQNGMTTLTIAENLRAKIADTVDIDGNHMVDLTKFTELYNDSFAFEFIEPSALSSHERQTYDAIPFVTKAFGGLPRAVLSIRISNTMRPDLLTSSPTVGCWDPNTQSIVILREQLKTFSNMAGTLLHEMLHAKTGYSDVTRDFETALTGVMGTLCDDLHNVTMASVRQEALPSQIAATLEREKQKCALLATENAGLQGRLNFALTSLNDFHKAEDVQRINSKRLEAELKRLQECNLLVAAKETAGEQSASTLSTDGELLASNERLSSKLNQALKSIVQFRKNEDAQRIAVIRLEAEVKRLQERNYLLLDKEAGGKQAASTLSADGELLASNERLSSKLNQALKSIVQFRKNEDAQRIAVIRLEAEVKRLQERNHLLVDKETGGKQAASTLSADGYLLGSKDSLSSKLDDALKSIIRLRKSESTEKQRADYLAGELRTLQMDMAKFRVMQKAKSTSTQERKSNKAWYRFW